MMTAFSQNLFSQTAPVILDSGPDIVIGIPEIGSNAFKASRGTYLAEGKRIEVYFAPDKMMNLSSWKEIKRKNITFWELPNQTGYSFIQENSWGVFIFFDPSFEDTNFRLSFAETFFSRVITSVNLLKKDYSLFSFPAVLILNN